MTLGNLAAYDDTGAPRPGTSGIDWGLSNTTWFQRMAAGGHWSGTRYVTPRGRENAFAFNTQNGQQIVNTTGGQLYAVAVRDGDVMQGSVGVVPEPSTLALLGWGLCGLGAVRLRRRLSAAGRVGYYST